MIHTGTSLVPKIIHQIAPKDTTVWPHIWNRCQQSWLKLFPDFEYKLWNDKEDIDNFVYLNYPEFSNLYNLFPVHIMKIDFVRLCLLHKFGGIYADMDYFVYKNFYHELKKDVGFIENLTEEYTTARYENSLMYSMPNNPLLYELMKYVKMCFIHHRNRFQKLGNHWRTIENDSIINNTTGSGMLSEGIKFFKNYFDIDALDCETFNNRPASYDECFYGKHVHTSLWGNEYCIEKPDHILIKNGMMYGVFGDSLQNVKNLTQPYEFISNEDFNFYKDYTNGRYLKNGNLEEIKLFIKESHL